MSDSPDPPAGGVPVAAAIAALRDELVQAWNTSESSRLRFRPAPIELTVEVGVVTDKTARAGVRWWLIEAGGEASRQVSGTHTVKLTLDPVMFDEQGGQLEFFVSDSDETGPPAGQEQRLSDAD